MTNIDELERLAKAATPGPWCDRGFGSIQPEIGGSLVAVTVTKGGCLPGYVENAAFIAAANPAAILALIAEVRALREKEKAWPDVFGDRLVSVDIHQGHHGGTMGHVHDAVNIGEAITRMADRIHPEETHVTIVAKLIRRDVK